MFEIQKAKRELIWVKVALMAASGGGKSYSSLRLATGMLEELKKLGLEQNGKILLGNTEQKRGLYYANEFSYDIVNIHAPHEPEMYVDFIRYAVEQDYPILILDSTSHEWEGKGGCLELHQQAGGNYPAWAKVTPRHNKFLIEIADSPIHIIATMRGKDQYVMETDDNRKTTIKKVGLGAKQREGFEYEFTTTFMIDQKTNLAESQKDNTHIFEEDLNVKLTEEHGKRLVRWSNSGDGYTVPVREVKSAAVLLAEMKAEVVQMCKDLGGSKDEELMKIVMEYDPKGNPNKIKDGAVLAELKEKLENLKEERG